LGVLGDPVGLVAGVGPLRDRLHQADVVHLLERAAAQVGERTLAADHQDRRVGAPGVGHAGHAVGDARTGGDRRHADLAGVAARPGVGRVDGGLLVAHVHDPDAFVDAPVVERHDVAAGQGEHHLDARVLERARQDLAAVDGHGGLLVPLAGLGDAERGTVSDGGASGDAGGAPSVSADDAELHAAVPAPGRLVAAVPGRRALAAARGPRTRAGHAEVRELLARRVRAPLAEREVVLLAAALVGVALDDDLAPLAAVLDRAGVGLQRGARVGA